MLEPLFAAVPPVSVYLVRHAEAHNPGGILYGRLPRIDLSSSGREQAGRLAEAMAALQLEAIYHSPLLRARRTALAIGRHQHGVPLRESALLLENRHPLQGRPQAEVAKLGDRVYDPDVLGAEGESIAALSARLARFLRQVARRHPEGVVAAVAHADPLAALRATLLGKELKVATLRQEAPPLASVFRFDLLTDGTTRLEWFYRPPGPPPAHPAASKNGSSG